MSSNTSQPPNRDPLKTLLKDAEKELRNRLHAACEAEAKGVSTESTEEIRKLEDDLLAAAVAAKQTIAVRSQMKRATTRDEVKSGDREAMGVREFSDDGGKPWRAWSVVPGLSRASASGGGFLGNYQDGWICFESLGSSARRRLPYPRAKWPNTSDEELRRLLERAADAPLREKKT
jgi:hypothetical protein